MFECIDYSTRKNDFDQCYIIYISAPCTGISFNFQNYFGWTKHMDYLRCLEKRYADRCQTIDIGNSVEGRSLNVMKISSPSSNGKVKPAIWIDGGIHAREWISPSSVQYLIYELVENYDKIKNREIVDAFDVYVLPIMNPDGSVFTVISYQFHG